GIPLLFEPDKCQSGEGLVTAARKGPYRAAVRLNRLRCRGTPGIKAQSPSTFSPNGSFLKKVGTTEFEPSPYMCLATVILAPATGLYSFCALRSATRMLQA